MEPEYTVVNYPKYGEEMSFHEDKEPDYRADDQMIQDWQAARYMTEPD